MRALRPIEHSLLAERQALGLAQERQALEHVGHVVDRAGPHLVGIVLEAAFPVLMVVDLAVAQEREQPLDFLVADGFAQTDVVHVCHRNQNRRVVRNNPEVKETARGAQNSFFFDPFDDAEPVVRVDDLVADLECHVSPVEGRVGRTGSCRETAPTSIPHRYRSINQKCPKNWRFRHFNPVIGPLAAGGLSSPPIPVNPGISYICGATSDERGAPARYGRVSNLESIRYKGARPVPVRTGLRQGRI